MTFDVTVPVLIIGAGACGAVAALAVADAGIAPLVVEQDDRPGGSTGMSQGLFCAAGTLSQREHGVDDDAAIFFADIMAKSRGGANPAIAMAIAEHSALALEWLRSAHGLPWELDTRFKASYGNSRLRVHGWPGHGGLDMVQLLHRRMADAQIDVLMKTRLVDIIANPDGVVRGVALRRADGEVEMVGCEALVLACGGFGANRALTSRHMPETDTIRYNGHEGSRGDAILLGQKLGAAVGDMGSYQGYAMLTDPQAITVPPGILLEGGMIVNADGDRFTDETLDIAGMVHPLCRQRDALGWVVFDAEIERRCAHIPEIQALIDLKAAKAADTVADLADRTGMDADRLGTALMAAHSAARMGIADSLRRIWQNDAPPPTPPYRALRVTGALYHTQGGLEIDADARVLKEDGSIMPNLFAGGGSARSVSGPSSWGYLPAMGLTTAVVLGHIAGTSAARLVKSSSGTTRQ
ncbi:FAD-dependent oxidoreductase [Sphingomonas hengshuiensis]|uniref:Fumarate reductase n=1 Tax=Sphingomonas hengshuiensis TaxID=1609977 RepID=A0A7U5HVM8_9SPHN|nr:FAD-dependent oxidoreductase [Sphingomonas hengshuiensis]AJP74056.1 fumarate reductase [Sphingomonas hengshuiensis]